ncbi:MAG: hypothetical protein BWZ10_01186 [candidate division BRC1 bacterium ADurb.BinA364]|nr:MAG: hypothetical protein BWZ10_01186 [candidate division BRC1 bacterium ADurb.BinA364]
MVRRGARRRRIRRDALALRIQDADDRGQIVFHAMVDFLKKQSLGFGVAANLFAHARMDQRGGQRIRDILNDLHGLARKRARKIAVEVKRSDGSTLNDHRSVDVRAHAVAGDFLDQRCHFRAIGIHILDNANLAEAQHIVEREILQAEFIADRHGGRAILFQGDQRGFAFRLVELHDADTIAGNHAPQTFDALAQRFLAGADAQKGKVDFAQQAQAVDQPQAGVLAAAQGFGGSRPLLDLGFQGLGPLDQHALVLLRFQQAQIKREKEKADPQEHRAVLDLGEIRRAPERLAKQNRAALSGIVSAQFRQLRRQTKRTRQRRHRAHPARAVSAMQGHCERQRQRQRRPERHPRPADSPSRVGRFHRIVGRNQRAE